MATLVAGCATVQPPNEELMKARQATAHASTAPIDRSADGLKHLQLARAQLLEGKQLMDHGMNERARAVFQNARADAELAYALADQESARADAANAMHQLEALNAGTRIP